VAWHVITIILAFPVTTPFFHGTNKTEELLDVSGIVSVSML
jgi:hypothetical protein